MAANDESTSGLTERLRRAQAHLQVRAQSEIVAALGSTAALWTAADSPWMARAAGAIAAEAGFSEAMVHRALPAMIAPLAEPALAALAAQADTAAIDRRPRLTLQILPSNIPGHAAIASALALICRSATLLKPGHRDRVFSRMWAESLATIDPALADCVGVAYWAPGGGSAVIADSDLVIVTGSDDTVAALRRRAPGRCVAYGSRLSIAVVTAEASTPAALEHAATKVALDVATWDQRGCLSPRLCFVEGERGAAVAAARAIASALDELATRLPPAPLANEELLAVRRFRDGAEWAADAADGLFFAADPAAGSVAVDCGDEPRPAPAGRCLSVRPFASSAVLRRALALLAPVLEGAGIAAGQDQAAVTAALEPLAIPLVCPAGQLQRPPLDWRHGGRSRIAPWIEGD